MAAKRKKVPRVELKRLEAQTRFLSAANRIVFALMLLIVGSAVVASALPQQRRLKDLEFRLSQVLADEQAILAEKEYHEIEYRALKEDTEFLELKAMDRLNLHRPGQKVYRIEREDD